MEGLDMSSLFRRTALASAALAVSLMVSGAALAQLTTGALQGTAAIGDSVTIRNLVTEHKLDYLVGDTGRFHFVRLPVGVYEVVIHHPDGSMDEPIIARARLGETVEVN
jgi:hypothetical protein